VPITHAIDAEDEMARLEVTGPLRLEEIEQTVEALLADPAFRPGLRILSDHSRLQESASTELVMQVLPLLKRLAERLGTFKCALIVSGDASYGMGRMAEIYAQPTAASVRPFRSMDEAEAWLRDETTV